MTCDEMRDLLPLYAGGETEDNERIAVEAHLSLCSDCARELEEFRQARGLLEALREEETPPGTSSKIWKRVRDEMFPAKRTVAIGDGFLKCAAVLVIGVAIGYAAFTAFRPTEPVRAESPRTAPAEDTSNTMVHGPAFNAGGGDRFFTTDAPREERTFVLPRTSRPEKSYYLPRAETILTGGDRDF